MCNHHMNCINTVQVKNLNIWVNPLFYQSLFMVFFKCNCWLSCTDTRFLWRKKLLLNQQPHQGKVLKQKVSKRFLQRTKNFRQRSKRTWSDSKSQIDTGFLSFSDIISILSLNNAEFGNLWNLTHSYHSYFERLNGFCVSTWVIQQSINQEISLPFLPH